MQRTFAAAAAAVVGGCWAACAPRAACSASPSNSEDLFAACVGRYGAESTSLTCAAAAAPQQTSILTKHIKPPAALATACQNIGSGRAHSRTQWLALVTIKTTYRPCSGLLEHGSHAMW